VAAKPTAAKAVELRWQTPGGASYPKITERTLAAWAKDHLNYKISPEPSEDDPFEKTFTEMAAGTAPDILQGWGEYFWMYASKHQLANINDFVKDMDKKDLDDFMEWQWKSFQIPHTAFRFGMPRYVNMIVLYYNKQAFNEAKLDYPTEKWNHDNYQEALLKLTVKEGARSSGGAAGSRPRSGTGASGTQSCSADTQSAPTTGPSRCLTRLSRRRATSGSGSASGTTTRWLSRCRSRASGQAAHSRPA